MNNCSYNPIADCGFPIADFKLKNKIGNYLASNSLNPKIVNRQSSIGNAFTLVERVSR